MATDAQKRAQDYINANPNQYSGGLDGYVAGQKKKYADAVASGDTAYADRFKADAGRVGYSLDVPKPAVTVQSQPTYQAPSNQPSNFDYRSLLDQQFDNSQASQMQALRKERETAQQGLNKVETGAKQQAYGNRNSADVVNMQNAKNVRQSMADMGLLNSGDNITAQAGLNAQRQSALGDINQQESNVLTDVNEGRALINNNIAGDERALIQRLNAERAGMELDYGYRTNRDSRSDFESDRGFDRGTFESDRGFNYQTGRDSIGDSRYADETQYNRGRDLIGDTRYDNEFEYSKGQDALSQKNLQDEKTYRSTRDSAEDKKWMAQYERDGQQFAASQGLQWANLSQRQREQASDEAWKQKSFDNDNYWKEKNNELDSQPEPFNPKPVHDSMEKLYLQKDFEGNFTITDRLNAGKHILRMAPSSQAAKELLAYYGLNSDLRTYE